jgi:hypothetical protein
MLDYFDKATAAYNKVMIDVSVATRGMDKTEVKNKKSLTSFIDHSIGGDWSKIIDSIKDLSALDYKAVGGDDRKKMMKVGEKQISDFQAVKKSYLKDLDYALSADIPLPDGNKYPEKLKILAPAAYRSVKVLKTEIEAISARVVMDWEQFDKEEKAGAILAKGKAKTDKIANDEDRKHAKEVANAKQALLTFAPKLKSAVAKGAAAVQKIKSNPTPQVYNDEMNNAGRDLSQAVANIAKWQSHEDVKKIDAVKKMPKPGNLSARISEYGNGARRSIVLTANNADVLAELKGYSAILKEIIVTYADFMNGKLASKLESK